MAGTRPHQRTRLLLKIAELIEKHAEELATLESLDNGLTDFAYQKWPRGRPRPSGTTRDGPARSTANQSVRPANVQLYPARTGGVCGQSSRGIARC